MSGKTVIWHDIECGAYSADLALWEELADEVGGPVLELGCGSGRVALHLARRGHAVIGLDREPELVDALAERAEGLPVRAIAGDAREFELGTEVALALAPMQFLQLLSTSTERVACLASVAAQLRPGGRLAAAIVERMPEPDGAPPPLPDVRDIDGWVYSSLPVEAAVGEETIVLRRLRQTVSPTGNLSEEPNEVHVHSLSAAQLEAEAMAVGLEPLQRRAVPATDVHVGSVVVVLGKGG